LYVTRKKSVSCLEKKICYMTDRWVQVQGGPPTLLFTISDLYNSAAVCIKNRSSATTERVSVHVSLKPGASPSEQESSSHFALLCDANGMKSIAGSVSEEHALAKMFLGGAENSTSRRTENQIGQPAFALIPPESTVIAAVVSPKGSSTKLPSGLIVQVFSVVTSAENQSLAAATLTEAELKSREIDQWLKNRRSGVAGGTSSSPSPLSAAGRS
jgi:hypothetical protein